MISTSPRPGVADGFDAILVGASAGSLLAAIRLTGAGLRPLVVEKTALVGGGTAYSGGIVWAPNNHRMVAKGILDSTEEALAYLREIDHPRLADHDAGHQYVEGVPYVLRYVEDVTTLRWVTYTGLPDYYSELPGGKPNGRFLLPLEWEPPEDALESLAHVRTSLHAGGSENRWIWGRALIGALLNAALRLGVDVWLESPVEELIEVEDEVIGVRVRTPNGVVDLHASLGVLLNTGGFEWDETRTAAHVPGPRPFPQTPPGNSGDGHRMLEHLGVPLLLLDRTIAIPGVRIPAASNDGRDLVRILFQPLAKPHSIVINAAGCRFANESSFVDLATAMAEVDEEGRTANLPAYFLFDRQYVDKYGLPAGAGEHFPLIEADDLSQLAARLGVPSEALAAQVETFNREVACGGDTYARGSSKYQRVFGDKETESNPTLGPLNTAPYCAIELVLTTSGHRGGAEVDRQARVIGAGGKPVRWLYACGNVAAGTVTGAKYFSGASLGHALLLADAAARDMIERHAARSEPAGRSADLE